MILIIYDQVLERRWWSLYFDIILLSLRRGVNRLGPDDQTTEELATVVGTVPTTTIGRCAFPARPDYRRDDGLFRGRAVARTATCGAESTRSAAHRTDALPRATRARRGRHPRARPLAHRRPADAAPTCTPPIRRARWWWKCEGLSSTLCRWCR